MAENETGAAAPQGAPQGADGQPQMPQLRILGQFIRDMSFENIVSRKGATGQVQPDVQVQVSLDAKKRQQDKTYEVVCKYTVTSKNKESGDTLFLLELQYGGVFFVDNVAEQQLHPFLMIECPRMLFPFVRRIINDITHDGGFPPLSLENIDFVQLYRQGLAQRAQQAQTEGENAAPEGQTVN